MEPSVAPTAIGMMSLFGLSAFVVVVVFGLAAVIKLGWVRIGATVTQH